MLWGIAIFIMGLGIYRFIVYHLKVRKYYKTSAIVIGDDIQKVSDPLQGDKFFYAPIVTFTDRYGQAQQMICGEDSAGRPLYKQGTKLTILVHPHDSSRFLVYDFISGYLIPVIWIIIGAAVVAIPALFPEAFT